MLRLAVIATLFLGAHGAVQGVEPQILAAGYKAETHNVTTKDGYVLTFHRTYKNNTSGKAVFLMHGVALASNSFIHAGKQYAMAYNLADSGYDVWMGNARGNNYSHFHISLDANKDDIDFFDFNYEEIALYDIPAMVDYALATSKKDKIHYVGHSLGGTVFLVLNSMNVTYQSKFASAHLLAGIGYETNFPNPEITYLSTASDLIYSSLVEAGDVEMKPTDFTGSFLRIFMNTTIPSSLDGGASVKEVTHICQNIRDKTFARWNYGAAGNMAKYGTATPPAYDLSKVNVSLTLHYSVSDATQSEADVLAMAKTLPNAVVRKVARDTFSNLDYIAAQDTKVLITNFIINSIANS